MIAEKPISASALNVARCRAIAAHDTRAEIQGRDYLAEIFIDEAGRQSLQNPAVFPVILKKLADFSPGGYEYFIARTAYLDVMVEQAFIDGLPQVVFLGAGYDTRPYRFGHLLHGTRVFELDETATQQHKRQVLAQEQVTIPAAVTFVTVDLMVDDLATVLQEAGYKPDQRTLFVWEGVTYYLTPAAVDRTMAFIRGNAPAGSLLCFDYMLPQDQLEGRFGARQGRAAMQALYVNEPLRFDLDEAQVYTFLKGRGFELVDHVSAVEMQQRYLTLHDGSVAGPILDLFRLVLARVAGQR